jgi:hypothetical protein
MSSASRSSSVDSSKCAVFPPGAAHTRPRHGSQQFGRALGTGILHRKTALKEAGQSLNRYGLFQYQAGSADRASRQASRFEPCQIVSDCTAAQIDTQGHRRRLVAGSRYGHPVVPIGTAQSSQPPAWILMMRFVIPGQIGEKRFALTQKVAQHAIDQPFEHAPRQFSGSGNRLIDDHRG